MDLRSALDFAIMIEEDAQVRYQQLARTLGADPGGAGDVFRAMVVNEGKHRSELAARRAALFGREARRIEISVALEDVERPDVDDDLPRTARAALEVSLAAERRAEEFYRQAIPQVSDPAVRAFFEELREEEAEHGALLAAEIARLAARTVRAGDDAPPLRPTAAPGPRESYADRALLEAVLPRFDAATQAVAAGVIVAGLAQEEVATALGVSRRTVQSKLDQFLGIARQHLAMAVTAGALAGCGGELTPAGRGARATQGESPPVALAVPSAAGAEPSGSARIGGGPGAQGEPRADLGDRIRERVATAMRRHDPAVHGRVAQAIVAEARLADVDPLLVVALIGVESSFNPRAVSSAGAVGLMQLREPTMRREVARSRLPSADRRDPVANVQAGVRYLRRLIDAFGDLDLALMAYNAGPTRVRDHLRRGEIPRRFHGYPRKVKVELHRLRLALGEGADATRGLAAVEPLRRGPVG
jgi:rubrerythrin